MSIEGKHSYRFVYLKSEKWQNVRIEALAREKGKCQICGEESISNDAHHMWYPESIWETTESHLIILCRPCHDFIHTMVPDCKTSDEDAGRAHWLKFYNAILVWRRSKIQMFGDANGIRFPSPQNLREELARVKLLLQNQQLADVDFTKGELVEIYGQFKKLSLEVLRAVGAPKSVGTPDPIPPITTSNS